MVELGETEAGSAGKQPAKRYLGLRSANGVSGSGEDFSAKAVVFRTIGHRSHASKIQLGIAPRTLLPDEPKNKAHATGGTPLYRRMNRSGSFGFAPQQLNESRHHGCEL